MAGMVEKDLTESSCKTETVSNYEKQSGHYCQPTVYWILTFLTSLTR